jgi:hypothetical protein
MAKNVNSDADPKMNQRDPTKPWNQPIAVNFSGF